MRTKKLYVVKSVPLSVKEVVSLNALATKPVYALTESGTVVDVSGSAEEVKELVVLYQKTVRPETLPSEALLVLAEDSLYIERFYTQAEIDVDNFRSRQEAVCW